MAALNLKNVTAPGRVMQKSRVIAHFNRRKNVFHVQLSFSRFFIARWRACQKINLIQFKTRIPTGCCTKMKKIAIVRCQQKPSK